MNLESVPTVNSGTIAFFNSTCMRVQSMYCPTYCCLHRKKLSIHRRLSCCFNYFFLEKSTLLEFFKDFIESHIDKHGSFAMKSIFSERNLSTSCNRQVCQGWLIHMQDLALNVRPKSSITDNCYLFAIIHTTLLR